MLSIVIAMVICKEVMILLRIVHDYVRPKNEKLIERNTEIAGRITSIVIGPFAVEMIMQGLKEWPPKLGVL